MVAVARRSLACAGVDPQTVALVTFQPAVEIYECHIFRDLESPAQINASSSFKAAEAGGAHLNRN
jgi:hypothetical protein